MQAKDLRVGPVKQLPGLRFVSKAWIFFEGRGEEQLVQSVSFAAFGGLIALTMVNGAVSSSRSMKDTLYLPLVARELKVTAI
jgi:hypothetical protein